MRKYCCKRQVAQTLRYLSAVTFGVLGVVFSSTAILGFNNEFFIRNYRLIISLVESVIINLTIFSVITIGTGLRFLHKICFIGLFAISLFCAGYVFFNKSELATKITSIESFREYIESFGTLAVFYFILIQFLQVVVLPFPSFVTVAAGVLMFGPFYGALFSSIGIIVGSIVAFFIGKLWGSKVVIRLVGENNFKKGIELTRGKSKIIFSLMFLFPLFPDDIICFVAGITGLETKSFIVIVTITRLISIFTASYSINNNLIPYNTWWGVLLWAMIFIAVICIVLLLNKSRKHKEK